MPKQSTDKFLEVLRRSGLVPEDQLTPLVSEFEQAHGPLPKEDADELAEFLQLKEVITSWQIGFLKQGKAQGFFLGKHKLLDHLGSGGMSSVYLAENVKLNRRVAIKVLPHQRVNDSSYLARFYREARASAALDHPNIVRAFDIDNDGKYHYLVMEYIEGMDLHQMVKRDGPMPYRKAAEYIRQSALGLAHAHEMRLIHRDVKPANLLVDMKGAVKLLDLGLARFSSESQASLTIAHEENVLGTADYLSPEQAINSHSADSRTDIYSLGCTMYFLLTGHPPFPNGTLPERLLKHQREEPASILEDRPDAPEDLVAICQRMMAKKLEDRYANALDVSEALASWLIKHTSDEAVNRELASANARGKVAKAWPAGDAGSCPGSSRRNLPTAKRLGDQRDGGQRDGGQRDGGQRDGGPREGVRDLNDTLSDIQRATVKGPSSFANPVGDTKRGSSARIGSRKLKVAKPLDESSSGGFSLGGVKSNSLDNSGSHPTLAARSSARPKKKPWKNPSFVAFCIASALAAAAVTAMLIASI